MSDYAKRFGANHPLATRKYALGDVNCSLIRTVNGRTIILGHDTQLPRPYEPYDMNVYDAASWSVVSELTERSVANKSRRADFPDFTRGKWKTNAPLEIVGV